MERSVQSSIFSFLRFIFSEGRNIVIVLVGMIDAN
jgi:hypothetical protein